MPTGQALYIFLLWVFLKKRYLRLRVGSHKHIFFKARIFGPQIFGNFVKFVGRTRAKKAIIRDFPKAEKKWVAQNIVEY